MDEKKDEKLDDDSKEDQDGDELPPPIDYMKNRKWFSGRGEFLGRYALKRREDPNRPRTFTLKSKGPTAKPQRENGKVRKGRGFKKKKKGKKKENQDTLEEKPRGEEYRKLHAIDLHGNQMVAARKLRAQVKTAPPEELYDSNMPFLQLMEECEALGIDTGNREQRYKLAMSESELLLHRLMAQGVARAVIHGDHLRLEKLIAADADTEGLGPTGYTALTWAVLLDDEKLVVYLIDEADCDPGLVSSRSGYGPLHAACRRGQTGMARLLLGRGAPLEQADAAGMTPFILACRNGHLNLCKVLLELGAEIEATTTQGNTAFLEAARWGHTEVCEMLMEAGCDRKVCNEKKENAFLLAVRYNHTNMVNFFLREKIECKVPTHTGECPLHIAVMRGNADLVNTLLRSKQGWSTRNTKTKAGYTPLHYAARYGYLPIVEMLIEANATVDVVSKFGFTPLIWAAHNNYPDICQVLLKNGADKDLVTTWLCRPGVSARVVAAECGHSKIVRLLMSAIKVKPRPSIEVPYYLLEAGQSAQAFKF
eukprot:g2916.t1